MITFSNGGRLCQSLDELPGLDYAKNLYLDFETTSGNPELDSLNPWHHCYICGICVTADDVEGAWYVPLGHNTGNNLPYEAVYVWLRHLIETCGTWVNHNVKYDMHVYSNNLGVRVACPKVYDTLALAKIVDSDRMRYGLDYLSKDWLGEDISGHEAQMRPYLKGNKDYGWIPADIMGAYGCQDVLTNRKLHKYIEANLHADCQAVAETECDVTFALYDIERSGMNIDVNQVRATQLITLRRMLELDFELEELIGYPIRAASNDDCYDVLINKHGLPILEYTDSGNPSFDKHTLKAYLSFPNAPVPIVERLLEYRRLSTFNSVFLTCYLEENVDGVLHPSYNQTVRTGRMSCRQPNMQQLMPEAKRLIVPRPGHILISADYSQIEFRVIVHYIKDDDAITAYNEDPDTDFHTWVAALCDIKRKPAKTINFLMGYGGGRARLLSALSTDADLVASIDEKDPVEFARLANIKAQHTYDTYHARLPSLKRTTYEAERLCRQRGWVKNIYGRHRHLPVTHARKAFNSVCQSSAADLMKERLVALWRAGYELVGSVHDEIIITMPVERYTDEVRQNIVQILEAPEAALRVPIRASIGSSLESWKDASDNSCTIPKNS